mgnify:FL=1
MAVFMRRGGNGKKKPVSTVWKKYSIAYSGNTTDLQIGRAVNAMPSPEVVYYTGFDFPKTGNPTITGEQTVVVPYNSAASVTALKKSLIRQTASGNTYQYYYGTSKNITTEYSESTGAGSVTMRTYKIKKEAIGPITEATARDMAIPGDYIELVESENSEMYPENGPYGLYWYIKQ